MGAQHPVTIHIADVTVMREGYCVIGLQESGGRLVCLRPVPRAQHAWQRPLPRGAKFQLVAPAPPHSLSRPHIEDWLCDGFTPLPGGWTERQLAKAMLCDAVETADDLFGAPLEPSPYGRATRWVSPQAAKRSIAAAHARQLEIVQVNPADGTIRARVTLGSGEVIGSVKVVDVTWRRWLDARRDQPAITVLKDLRAAWHDVAPGGKPSVLRFGLSRPLDGRCWLMLDTILPSIEV